MSTQDTRQIALSEIFHHATPEASSPPPARKKNTYSPFSIRFSKEERSYLEQQAGNRPLGAYIRDELLAEKAQKRRTMRKPSIEDGQYATLLAALGQSRLSSNLNQLSKHANTGTLDVSEDIEQQLQDACQAILAMRKALFIALGLRSGGGS
ncbi:Glycosyltransferase [hydrothermal vent metagenome]|uniref:Glycosyltransferase n=1 Tax=hydrothermal vent metagenome TaxID=652676 RepID=A0A3B0VBH1_9ZZZZ